MLKTEQQFYNDQKKANFNQILNWVGCEIILLTFQSWRKSIEDKMDDKFVIDIEVSCLL